MYCSTFGCSFFFFLSSRRRHTRCALVTGVQTCALPILATSWEFRRRPWVVKSGVPGSKVWKTTDGGDTWREITKGLPALKGKMGVAISPEIGRASCRERVCQYV